MTGSEFSAKASADLVGLSREELSATLAALGEPAFRADQLWHWIYHRGESDFARMTTLAKSLREKLAATHRVGRPEAARDIRSLDGTRKWLLRFEDGNEAETVLIPEDDRGALCVSSQVGCTLSCSFCHTGTQKLVRNLTAAEIVGQVLVARDRIGEWPAPKHGRLLSNVVMMGMGEPLFNYANVAKALKIVMDGEGLAISKRRITLSTAGVVPMIGQVGRELGDVLVPINRKYPLKDLFKALREYPADNTRRITFEYVMLKGVNDSDADAKELVRLARGLPVKFNLIPFNPWPGATYECSDERTMKRFAALLNQAGYSAPIRAPRGRDILAACGQLRSASIRARRPRAAERVAVAFAAGLAVLSGAAFAQSGGVTVENPFARPSAGATGAGTAYLTIRNPGAADRLLSAQSPVAGRVELHDHIREGDVMKMRKVDAIPVPANGMAELKPGGLHVMLMGLHQPLKTGDSFALTLTFEKAGAVTIQVPVKDMSAGAAPRHGAPRH
jgi:23S rRNA (adenine2503-C2)-methyltransferase